MVNSKLRPLSLYDALMKCQVDFKATPEHLIKMVAFMQDNPYSVIRAGRQVMLSTALSIIAVHEAAYNGRRVLFGANSTALAEVVLARVSDPSKTFGQTRMSHLCKIDFESGGSIQYCPARSWAGLGQNELPEILIGDNLTKIPGFNVCNLKKVILGYSGNLPGAYTLTSSMSNCGVEFKEILVPTPCAEHFDSAKLHKLVDMQGPDNFSNEHLLGEDLPFKPYQNINDIREFLLDHLPEDVQLEFDNKFPTYDFSQWKL